MTRKETIIKGGTSSNPAEKKEEFFTRRKWEEQRALLLLLSACKSKSGPTVGTPVTPWKDFNGASQNTIIKGANTFHFYPCFSFQFSARKLGAALWEFQHYFDSGLVSMYLGVNNHHQRARRLHHRGNKDEGFDHHHHHLHHHDQVNQSSLPVDPHRSGSPDHHQPASAGSLRRHIAASLMRHHQSTERNKHTLQPLSPASYGSSLEIAPYNPAATPGSSIELRERMGEPIYGFKTSTELLKVLNRIWTLEEQHASNMALVRALKNELNHARGKIKELLRDQQANRHEIDDLMKQISQANLARKSTENERLEAALQSVRDELEDERKLRKRSESLHRKLARELFEIKVALSTTVKELEKERKSRELLEDLCDEFSLSVREYAKQMHDLKYKSEGDNLILQISESWGDEREQMREREPHKGSIVEKLRPEIESFLTARTSKRVTKDTHPDETRLKRMSLESIPEAGQTPPADLTFTDTHSFELRKGQSPPSVQMMNTPLETDPGDLKTGEGTPTEISMLQKSEIYDSYQKKKNYNEEGHGSNSKAVEKLMSELLLSEGGTLPHEYEYKEASSNNTTSLRRNVSPVRQWVTSMKSPGPKISDSSSKSQSVRENSLKAKLQEPKLKGQRSRLKILKGSS